MSGAVLSRRKNENEEVINVSGYLGLHHNALRLHLRRATGQVGPYWFTNAHADANANPDAYSNSNSDSDSNAHTYSHTNAHANSNANSNAHTYSYANSYSDSDADSHADSDPGAGPYSPARNRCETESRHSGRSGGVDDLNKLDAHQSGTWNPPEHRQRPVHRRVRELSTGPGWLPDWLRLGHDLDSFDGCVQDHTSSFRRLL
jgi:hypothetical protein